MKKHLLYCFLFVGFSLLSSKAFAVRPNLSYAGPYTFTAGTAVTITPTNSGGAPTSCTISPALPAGLSISATTGVISGTPTAGVPSGPITYTVTPSNGNGTQFTLPTFSLTIVAPPNFTYASGNVYSIGTAIPSLTPTNSGSAATSCTIAPALPTGLSISATGVISGTPSTVTAGFVTYQVTATNSAGSKTSNSFTIAVIPSITYTTPNAYQVNSAVTLTPTYNGGTPTSCTISPALPSGLSISATGVISGTPTATTGVISYVVTATYSGINGNSNTFTIAINPNPPAGVTYATGNVFTVGTAASLSPLTNTGGPITNATISPALPAGLSISTAGVISGTPSVATGTISYVVTASNAGGSTTSNSFTIVVNPKPPALIYTATNVYPIGSTVNLTPSNSGGATASTTISPSLPAGLSISAAGVISGTPTAVTPAATYTVTATNAGGTANSNNFTIAIIPAISYSSPNVYTVGTPVTLTPTYNGGTPTNCTISPALPAGLSINASGVISGTPSVVTGATSYTVTATYADGNGSSNAFTITVNPQPPALTYSTPNTFTVGTAATLTPTNAGGTATGSTISPALPAGLSINATGVISGNPTTATGTISYVVTSTNAGGSTSSNTFTITVNPKPPALTYASNTYNVGSAVTLTPANTGGAATSTTIAPSLPAGLSISATGVISGTPTAASPNTSYVVTATNAGGTANSNTFTITIIGPPVIAYSPSTNVYPVGTPIATLTPSNMGSAVAALAFGAGTSLNSTTYSSPEGLAFNASGNLYVTNYNNGRIRMLNAAGTYVSTPVTISGNPMGIVFDAAGNAYVIDQNSGDVFEYNSGGSLINTIAPNGGFNDAYGIAIDAFGNLYVADAGASTRGAIIKFNTSGTVLQTITTNINGPTNVAVDPAGNIYALNNNAGTVTKYNSSGGYQSAIITGLNDPYALTIDGSGNIYVGDDGTGRVYVYASTGGTAVTTITGLNDPEGIAVDSKGYLYVSDAGNYTVTRYPVTGSYHISAPLPPGLVFNTATGAISGTPTAGFPTTTYTVTAYNSSGSGNTTVTITCTSPPIITYGTPNVYTVGTAIPPLTPTNTGSVPTTYAITTGTLPSGLSINTNTGVISGTATAALPLTSFVVTGTNAYGTGTSNTFNITVNQPVPVISYTTPDVYTVGATVNLTPTNSQSAVTTGYTISGTLPAGLSFNTTTGVISGTATPITPATTYTVTANTGSSTGSTKLTITINDKIPVISYVPPVDTLSVGVTIPSPISPTVSGGTVTPFGFGPPTALGGAPYAFNGPSGIGSDPAGNIYITNYYGGSITELSSTGTFIKVYTKAATGMVNPDGIVFDNAGNAYVVDRHQSDGNPGTVYKFAGGMGGTRTTIIGGLSGSFGIGIDQAMPAQSIYVTQEGPSNVIKYSLTGVAQLTLPTANLNNPTDVAIDNNGNIYVQNYANGTGPTGYVEYYKPDGTGATQLIGSLRGPWTVHLDGANNVYVANSAGNTCQIFGPSITHPQLAVFSVTDPEGFTSAGNGVLFASSRIPDTVYVYKPTGGYFIDKELPPGLIFDSTTGQITGTPTVTFPTTTYTVTAWNSGGPSVGAPITLTCVLAYDWIGNASQDWNNPLNWASHVIPVAGNTAYIGVHYAFNSYPIVSQTGGTTVTVGNVALGNKGGKAAGLSVANGYTLNVIGSISKQSDANSITYGNLSYLSGLGTINVLNVYALATSPLSGVYTESLTSSVGNLNISGNLFLTSSLSGTAANAAFNVSGGTTTLTGTSGTAGLIKTTNVSGATSTIAVTGGTFKWMNPTTLSSLSTVASSNVFACSGTGFIEYGGASQTVYTDAAIPGLANGINYQGIRFSGTGIKTPNGNATNNLNVAGDFTNLLANDAGDQVTLTGTIVNFNGTTQALAGGAGTLVLSPLTATPTITGTVFNQVNFSGAGTKTMTGGVFSVQSTGVLTMQGSSASTILNAGGFLTLRSDANSSATVAAIPAGPSITGNVNVQRFISGSTGYGRGYRLFSSPVYGSSSTSGSVTTNIYSANYLMSGMYLKGTSGTGFDGAGNDNIYLYRENLAPSNTSFTSGNYRGVNSLGTTWPVQSFAYPMDGGDGTVNIPVGDGMLVFFRGDRTVDTYANETSTTYVPTNSITTAIGTLNQGSISPVDWYTPSSPYLGWTNTAGNSTVQGFNLLGNPYASSINWESYNTSTPGSGIYANNVGNTVYEFNPKTQNYDTYQVGGLYTNNGTATIVSGQGFFVVAANATNPQITFNESAKVFTQNTGPSLLMATRADVASVRPVNTNPDQHLRLQLAMDSVNTDDIYVGFKSSAKTAYVFNEDAPYKTGQGKLGLSSFSSDSKPLAINVMSLSQKSQTIKLNVTATLDGNFTLNMKELKGIPAIYEVWLMDAKLKDSLDMRANQTYTFSITHTDTTTFGANRFTLVIRENPALALQLLNFAAAKAANGSQVTWKTANEQNYTNFTVERSTDNGKTFEVLGGFLSNALGAYNFTDTNPVLGTDDYRLKLDDLNGNITYSSIVPLLYSNLSNNIARGALTIYPNPTVGTLNVAMNQSFNSSSFGIQIVNSSGTVIQKSTSSSANWQSDVSKLLPGTYVIQVVNNADKSVIGKGTFVKL